MMHVILDTNIYRKNPRLNDMDFNALSRLGKARRIQLYIPYIVKREFQSQQFLKSQQAINIIDKQLDILLRNNLTSSTKPLIKKIKSNLLENQEKILLDSEKIFEEWYSALNSKIIDLSLEQTKTAWETYFKGILPFKEPKIRNDIPDAFIVQAIEEVLSKVDSLFLICEDEKIKDTYCNHSKIRLCNSLSEFIKIPDIQDELKASDFMENINLISEIFVAHEKKSRLLKNKLQSNLDDKIIDMSIEHYSIPDDNNEATIISCYEPENININLETYSYYGDGVLGFDFNSTIRVGIFFYLFKGDYHGDNEQSDYYITDHNDHYYEVETECEIRVLGTIGVNFDYKTLNVQEIERLKENDKIDQYISDEIEIEIDSIELIGW